MKMRRAVLYEQEDLRIEECEVPEIGEGDVLVKKQDLCHVWDGCKNI